MILVMKEGVLHQAGKPQEVYDNPKNLFVATFLGTPPINVFAGEIKSGCLYIGDENVMETPGVIDREVYVGVRPEGFVLDAQGAFSCKLKGVEVMGRDITVVSKHALCENVEIRSIISAENKVDLAAEKVRFSLKPNKVLLFDVTTDARIYYAHSRE